MNRAERRAREARDRQTAKLQQMRPARTDGRPLYFDISPADRVVCYHCAMAGLTSLYGVGEAVMNDPANPPPRVPKGDIHTICKHHIPDNAVIYNPRTNMCRNKTGDHTWEEVERKEVDFGPASRGLPKGMVAPEEPQ